MIDLGYFEEMYKETEVHVLGSDDIYEDKARFNIISEQISTFSRILYRIRCIKQVPPWYNETLANDDPEMSVTTRYERMDPGDEIYN